MKKITTNEFILRSNLAHGDKYDYSKSNYINARTKVCIICPIHGEFWQKPHDHMRGIGCQKCKSDKLSRINSDTTHTFIEKARKVHGDKYDYSKVEYIKSNKKVCIICPKHGEFWQSPYSHLNGNGCPKCGVEKCVSSIKSSKEEFIEKARKIHGEKYNYSKVQYVNNKTKVCIICPIHGEFWQTPNAHLLGQGCNLCSKPIHDTKSFIEESKKIHGDEYDYSKVEYTNARTKVCIICPIHGEFWQTPTSHVSQKCGCPICKQSHLERDTREYLLEHKIKFNQEQMFNWLGMMKLDFYLPKHNIAIECQGIQHFKPIDFSGHGDKIAKKIFNELIVRDKLKMKLCKEHHIKIIYIKYDENVSQVLNKFL